MAGFNTFNYNQAIGGANQNSRNKLAMIESMQGMSDRKEDRGYQRKNQNRLAEIRDNQEGRAQANFDEKQQMENTRWMYAAQTAMAKNPEMISELAPQMIERGLVPEGADWQSKSMEEVRAGAIKGAKQYGDFLDGLKESSLKKQKEGFTLSQGQRRFDKTGKQIASVAPKPATKSGGSYGQGLKGHQLREISRQVARQFPDDAIYDRDGNFSGIKSKAKNAPAINKAITRATRMLRDDPKLTPMEAADKALSEAGLISGNAPPSPVRGQSQSQPSATQYVEGQRASNPKTGQTMMYKNGRWVPE